MDPSALLSEDLGMPVEDVVAFGRVRYGMDIDRAPESVVAIREDLDVLCIRSVPSYWWPGHDHEAGTGATKMI